ncbi:Uncharacterized protein C7orf50-like [Papilio machaon]|uniref:Uncharacterized protein C7orf50-like n=1 Tax=Papilio machaon TaxID=76193 RepID=A0A194R453_PAPMA|nr:uncharacterized protein C7orf50 homolog [Papilio machaon]KPJ12304.1 Uncharacterized protein C7orf50-like [Papilio machaon]
MGGKKKNKSKNKSQDIDGKAIYNEDVNTEKNNVQVDDIEDNRDVEKQSQKRKHVNSETNDENLDTDLRQKRSKKKKMPQPTESSDKKNKKSIRQMKKEKHAERQAAAEAQAKGQLKSQCLNYLSQWKHDKSNWKFMKAKQVWLFKNKFSQNLVPDASWPILLEYFESAKGNIRNMLLADANKVIKEMDDWTESQNNEENNTETEDSENAAVKKPEDIVYKRARSLIQCLEE